MADTFAEEERKPFDSVMAEELSLLVHRLCGDSCPHDIGIHLAQLVWEIEHEDKGY